MEKIILATIIGLFLVSFVSPLDSQLFQGCGGDSELIVGCIGDEELFFLGFDIINPQISIIYPTDGLSITNVVTGLYGLNVNFSVDDVNLYSCWYRLSGVQSISNTSIPCSSGYNSFIITITNFGLLTLDIFVRDFSNNENSSQVNFSVSEYVGPQSGGGTTTDPSIRDTVDFKKYDRGTMCEKIDHFLSTYPNYTSENRQDLINELAIVFGFGISEVVLDEYLENFEENCPEYFEPEEPEDIVDEDKKIYLWIWIVLAVIILMISFTILFLLRRKKSINIDKGPIKRFIEKIVREILNK